ncbi:MAG: response regulator [Candidatus Moranbacteria bacterium]|nr:response regulator [Candidatus Moranbacteria bacterium]
MRSILLVDPSTSMRQMVSFALKDAGFDVVAAVSGQDAREKSRDRDFALVLVHQTMPPMDSLGLTRKLRSDLTHRDTPILVVIADDLDDATRRSGRSAGVTDWIIKPISPAALVEAVTKAICRPV